MSHGVHRGILKRGKFDERENFINRLVEMTPNIRFDLYGMNNIQPIWADNYLLAISQSKIGLNLSQGKPAKYYSSDRFSQLIGNGLLVMIDEKTKIGNFFNKDEIVMYDSISDLSEKIVKFSNDYKLRNTVAKKEGLNILNILIQLSLQNLLSIKHSILKKIFLGKYLINGNLHKII